MTTLDQRLQKIAAENGLPPSGAGIEWYFMRLAAEAATEWLPIESAPEGIHLRAVWLHNAMHEDWILEVHSGYVDDDGRFANQYGDDYGIDPDDYFGWQEHPEFPKEPRNDP